MSRVRRLAALFLCFVFGVVAAPPVAEAQTPLPWLSGYYLNVPLWSDADPFNPGGFGDVQRLRLMVDPSLGPVSAEIAYEHLFSWSAEAGGAFGGSVPGAVTPGGGEWIDLQWVISDTEHVRWAHRFDRLNVSVSTGDVLEATVGRQAISWATTLLLTPTDPYKPFDPSDPFRVYRAGVDAARVSIFPGPLSQADIVIRPADFSTGETLSVLGRYRGVLAAWEISGYAGVLYDEPALSLAATGGIGQAALRGEVQFREEEDELVVRGTVGIDARVDAFGHDLYLVLEYQHDGFGASNAGELFEVVTSTPFARGELQVLSADVTAWQAVYQLHPLVETQLLVLWSLNDWSALFTPGASYSVSNEVTAQGGLFLGVGADNITPDDPLPSEYGIVPTTAFVSLSVFF